LTSVPVCEEERVRDEKHVERRDIRHALSIQTHDRQFAWMT